MTSCAVLKTAIASVVWYVASRAALASGLDEADKALDTELSCAWRSRMIPTGS